MTVCAPAPCSTMPGEHLDLPAVGSKPQLHRRLARRRCGGARRRCRGLDQPVGGVSQAISRRAVPAHRPPATRECARRSSSARRRAPRCAGAARAGRCPAPGDHVDMALAREQRLRRARRAHVSAGHVVGVDRVQLQPRLRHAVRRPASRVRRATTRPSIGLPAAYAPPSNNSRDSWARKWPLLSTAVRTWITAAWRGLAAPARRRSASAP